MLRNIELSSTIGYSEYNDTFDVDVFTEDRVCFSIVDDSLNLIYEVHVSDCDLVDYTIYDKSTLKSIDGGQIECDNCSLQLDVLVGLTSPKDTKSIGLESISLIDYDSFIDETY